MAPPQLMSRQAIDDFKKIFRKEFAQELSDDEAQDMALRVLRLFNVLSQPLPKDIPPGPSHSVSSPG